MFDDREFFRAFSGHNLLEDAVWQPATGAPVKFPVGFVRPDANVLGLDGQSTEYEIEFETSKGPAIKPGDSIRLCGSIYKAREYPRAMGDGYFSKLRLTRE